MTKNIEYCFEDDDLGEVVGHMESEKIRRLVVLEQK